MPKINIKALKARLSIDDYKKVMKALDIPAFSESNSTIIYFSGDKHRNALEGKPKLYLYKDTGVFVGYTSNRSYDIISLVQTRLALLRRESSFYDAVKFITETVGLELDTVKRIESPHLCNWQDSLGKFVRFKSTGSTLEPYDKSILDQLDRVYPQQWLDEGISADTMEKYGIGYYQRLQATTIPCFGENGDLIGMRGRFWSDEQVEMGKYRPITLLDGTTYKFPTNAVFYGINYNKPRIEETGHVILVEGEKSVLKADTFWGEKSNVLALYGSQIGSRRRNQLIKMGVNRVTLALDSDFHKYGDEDYDRFEEKMLNLGKLFKGYAEVDIVYNNIGLSDAYKCSPFDFNETTWNRLYEAREFM